ncbi:hypothetical protein [Ekhidna sp. To15]|uniref:hypothetical protein n=1 Tax=Ekhidna sp. To15 TaxID=3395267 RepID=UPI003F524424
MSSRTLYKFLIWTGLISFIAGFICEVNAVLYLRHLLIIGIVLFGIGIIVWLPLRLKKPILHPLNVDKYKSSGDALLAYVFNNYLLEFWGFCVAVAMMIVIIGGSFRTNSRLQIAINKLQESKELEDKIGIIQDTGIIVSSSNSADFMKFELSVYGSKDGARVDVELDNQSGSWEIKELKID